MQYRQRVMGVTASCIICKLSTLTMVGVAELNNGGLATFAHDGIVTRANAHARNSIFSFIAVRASALQRQ